MKHKNAKRLIIQYLTDTLKGKEKIEFENHINQCKDCKEELEELKEIISVIKRESVVKMDDEVFERIKNIAYKELRENNVPLQKFSPFLVPNLILSLLTFILSNLLFFQFFSKIFGSFSIFVFYLFLLYQFSGITFFLFYLIIKFKGGFENGKI